jgi:galactosamine-6-phosphate isomerase
LKIEIGDSYEAMSSRAADSIVAELKRQPNLLLCLSAGGTPTRTYELLAIKQARQPELFKRLRVLQIDEWGGLEHGSPESCAADLQAKILGPLRVNPNRYMGFATDAKDPETEAKRMQKWLAANGPIDVCLLGLGKNGHIAMNEPGVQLILEAHVAKLAASSQKHAMLKHMNRKPRYGLTLGLADILNSRAILLLVSGQPKRAVLKRVLQRRVTTRCPASFLWLHSNVTLLCDGAAAGSLRGSKAFPN